MKERIHFSPPLGFVKGPNRCGRGPGLLLGPQWPSGTHSEKHGPWNIEPALEGERKPAKGRVPSAPRGGRRRKNFTGK